MENQTISQKGMHILAVFVVCVPLYFNILMPFLASAAKPVSVSVAGDLGYVALVYSNTFVSTVGAGVIIVLTLYFLFTMKGKQVFRLALICAAESVVLFGLLVTVFHPTFFAPSDCVVPALSATVFVLAAMLVGIRSKRD